LAALQIRNLNNQEQSTAREIRWEWLAFAFIGWFWIIAWEVSVGETSFLAKLIAWIYLIIVTSIMGIGPIWYAIRGTRKIRIFSYMSEILYGILTIALCSSVYMILFSSSSIVYDPTNPQLLTMLGIPMWIATSLGALMTLIGAILLAAIYQFYWNRVNALPQK
jgi:hypothetical protein